MSDPSAADSLLPSVSWLDDSPGENALVTTGAEPPAPRVVAPPQPESWQAPDRETLILVDAVTVDYEIYQAADGTSRPLGRNAPVSVRSLTDVSLTLKRGEALGLVGMNGAGKSTLVRTMAGLQPASQGQVWVRSQPRLLGVNAAMRARLTGRVNIELGCVAMGYSRAEASELEERIVDFSELGDAIDRPIMSYSSGMRARLGFSIATVERPEILLLDEALAVGDANFKQKSLARLEKLKRRAGAMVMVSHSLKEIERVCDRVVWLDGGRIIADGEPDSVLDDYRVAAKAQRQAMRDERP